MSFKKMVSMLLVLALLCVCFGACGDASVSESMDQSEGTTTTQSPETQPTEAEPIVPDLTPVDVKTNGGAVIVGKIGVDDQGWYIQPEQPLNITFEYFLENPTVLDEQTRIAMFDPKDDGVEKATYIGQTVTVYGTFRFYRDDFETLYFAPYNIVIGKNAAASYGDPSLMPSDEPENLYDPSEPLPSYMDAIINDGSYTYNAFMLSRETLEFMGNDFAVFYGNFVEAFLNYQTEVPCPDKNYAEMLSTIIYYELPLYNACAEPFEFVKHYNAETSTVSIVYKYDEEGYKQVKEQFFAAANAFLADVTTDQTEEEKAKAIYHALSSKMTYDYSALEEFERKESYYAYLHNSGVCVTFANVYNQLLTQVGIDTTLAYCDNDDTIGHSWSIVTIDGERYFCDPTYELSYDKGNGYRFFGMNYADRIADGTGELGIRYGRYYLRSLDPEFIAAESLEK